MPVATMTRSSGPSSDTRAAAAAMLASSSRSSVEGRILSSSNSVTDRDSAYTPLTRSLPASPRQNAPPMPPEAPITATCASVLNEFSSIILRSRCAACARPCCVLCEELLCRRKYSLLPGIVESIESPRHQCKARICCKEIPVLVDEAPVEAVDRIAPRPFRVITHFQKVVGAANVRLGREDSAVTVKPHTVDVGPHHPLGRVHIHFHEPAMRCSRPNFTQRHQVAHHHESRDVVRPPEALRGANGVIERRDAGRPLIPGRRQFTLMRPEVTRLLLLAILTVNTTHELAPADNLANETLDALQRRITHAGDDLVDDFRGC